MAMRLQRRTWLVTSAALAALAACGRPDDPQASLEAAVP
jgi:predicted small lipoprotein YifL